MAPIDTVLRHHPIPPDCKKELPGFKGSRRLRHRKGAREAWGLERGQHAEWDYQHEEVEVYDKKGKHQGAFNPRTGEKLKEAIKDRRPTYQSVAIDALKAKAPSGDLVTTNEPVTNVNRNSEPGAENHMFGITLGRLQNLTSDQSRPLLPKPKSLLTVAIEAVVMCLLFDEDNSGKDRRPGFVQ
jgi:Cytotoxic